ncbi:hypothetical protein N7532_003587 [Penicillium argentinense]|uniref:Uncharacterized protein n=1 Tax=Penicillium argentinense TaxID=1131581 RepID=A0A9W9FMR3_9EURO|nr:uncharacterized protein N7532_003587 [Penicillium argentinense]KAJ5103058.1 hypothetical protein N7532_003587 [Penicillium argentinense]
MCVLWVRKYTVCGCIREVTTTACPPEKANKCKGNRMVFLKDQTEACSGCWKRGDKRKFNDDEFEAHGLSENEETIYSPVNRNAPPRFRNNLVEPSDTARSDSEPGDEIWEEGLEEILIPSTENQSSDSDDDVFVDALEYLDMDEERTSPQPPSRPLTPYMNLRHSAWLDIMDGNGVDASRVCDPVEQVSGHYRARRGPRKGYLMGGRFPL